ncbi:unnamed protein product [Urochloa decumbens]|uniref:MATH domain-containing protein n=1 Tax=Urochloa decumbens TaxID=240449 RepID=A0ABC9G9F4_9POAL
MSSSSVVPPPSFEFTSLRARQVTGSHLLRIYGHSAADRLVLSGRCIGSRSFSAGGRKWELKYYPNGHSSSGKPGAAATVELRRMDRKDDDDDGVMAAYRLSILDREGNPAYSYAVGPQRFDKGSKYMHRVNVLATPEERQAALRLVEDDSLTIRCDVSVRRFDKESRIKYYLQKLLDY